jgi:hypothetical protein
LAASVVLRRAARMSDERPEWQRMGVIVPSSQHNRRGGFRT